jgi:predicted dehydrogenase
MTDLAAVGTGPVTRPPPLPVGVVGAGRFATFLTEAVHDLPDIRFTAVADADPDRARRLAATLIARQLVDWRALIAADDADAVVIATPPATHAEITLAALRAGRHAFCEKPLITFDLGGEAAKQYVYAEGVRAAMADLVRCVRTAEPPIVGAAEGWAAVTVATAARRSAREERTIHLGHRAAGRAASPAPARTSPPPSRRRSPP